MKRRIALLAVACLSLTMLVMAPSFKAFPGGVDSSEQQYCGTSPSCHSHVSTATITIWASKQAVALGGDVDVTVNVSGGQAVDFLGVMIVSEKSEVSASDPKQVGWVIKTDPSGSTNFNYHETTTYTGSVSWTWSLSAPSVSGGYSLFARAMHGGGAAYAIDTVAGVSFLVGNVNTTGPTVIITEPATGSTLEDVVSVKADVLSQEPIRYVTMRLNGAEIGNTTISPYVFTLETTVFKDGVYTLQITAVDADGNSGSSQITITISNASESSQLIMWVWTMAAGTIAILAWIGVLIVVVLLIRKKRIEGRLG